MAGENGSHPTPPLSALKSFNSKLITSNSLSLYSWFMGRQHIAYSFLFTSLCDKVEA